MANRRVQYGVSRKRLRELLAEVGGTLDVELTARFSNNTYGRREIYELADGRVIMIPNESTSGPIYPSKEEFLRITHEAAERFRNEIQSQHAGTHILVGRLPDPETFLQDIPGLVDQLSVMLEIPRDQLDGSLESLARIDGKLRHVDNTRLLEPDLFTPLLACVGEVIRQHVGGTWKVDRDANTMILEPNIIDREGITHRPYILLYDVIEELPNAWLEAAVSALL